MKMRKYMKMRKQMNKMNIDKQIYFWAHMLDECFCKDQFLYEDYYNPYTMQMMKKQYEAVRQPDDEFCKKFGCIKVMQYDDENEEYYEYKTLINGIITRLPAVDDSTTFINGKFVTLNNDKFVPHSPKYINNNAFRMDKKLKHIEIPSGVTNIGDYAFADCRNLASIVIPNSVTSIGEEAFVGCWKLSNLVLPNSVTSIGYYAFGHCNGLTNITIPNSITNIESLAFNSCEALTSIVISNSVTNIGDEAFFSCNSLTNVTIPDSVTSIGVGAFAESEKLTTVIIPDSVINIGLDAFDLCPKLKHVMFKGKTLQQVEAMKNYPWGIQDTSIIKCKP